MKIFQQKTLWVLFISALVLLTFNILLEFILKSDDVGEFSATSGDLQVRFESSLKSFGLEDEWMKKKTVKHKNSERNYPSYQITLPLELSIPEVLLEIYNEFREDSLDIESNEKVAAGKSILTFKEDNFPLLSAEFKYSKKIKRERGALAFILENIKLNNLDDSLLVEAADKFNVIITPSEENLNHLLFITENRKNYSVLINDEIYEANYRLDASYPLLRISNVIKALSVDYANASFFVVDNNCDFYQSEKFRFFKTELEKRSINLYELSDFVQLDDKENISATFSKLVKDLSKGETKVIILTKEDYLQLKPEIALYRKGGVKILNASEVK